MANTTHPILRSLILAVLLVDFSGIIIGIAGIAKLTDMCRSEKYPAAVWQLAALTPVGYVTSDDPANNKLDCGMFFAVVWVLVVLQLVVILIALIDRFVPLRIRQFIVFIYTIVTTLYVHPASDLFSMLNYAMRTVGVYKHDVPQLDLDPLKQTINANLSSCYILIVCNVLYILLSSRENTDGDKEEKEREGQVEVAIKA